MRKLSISRFKATLSQCIESVSAGEEIIVTDRGRPRARLLPFEASPDDVLQRLYQEGIIELAEKKLPRGFLDEKLPGDRRASALSFLLEERDSSK